MAKKKEPEAEQLTFEQSLAELEQIVAKLEGGGRPGKLEPPMDADERSWNSSASIGVHRRFPHLPRFFRRVRRAVVVQFSPHFLGEPCHIHSVWRSLNHDFGVAN